MPISLSDFATRVIPQLPSIGWTSKSKPTHFDARWTPPIRFVRVVNTWCFEGEIGLNDEEAVRFAQIARSGGGKRDWGAHLRRCVEQLIAAQGDVPPKITKYPEAIFERATNILTVKIRLVPRVRRDQAGVGPKMRF